MKTKFQPSRNSTLAMLAVSMLFVALAGLIWINEAQAIRLSMKRIIFEGPKRSDLITIMNNTTREQTYRLGWRHYRMDEQRSLIALGEEEKDVAGIKWADTMISYAPRRVTVPAGGSQQVRVLLRRPRDLAPGEYRSHLWIVTEAENQEFDPGSQQSTTTRSFRLTMQPAVTMPIFVRVGDLTAQASISDARLSLGADGGTVNFVLNRSGDRSLYGDIKIICTGGKEYIASHTRGIAVYTEVSRRIFEYDFKIPPEHANDCRQVRVEYIADREDLLYSGQIVASATVSAN